MSDTTSEVDVLLNSAIRHAIAISDMIGLNLEKSLCDLIPETSIKMIKEGLTVNFETELQEILYRFLKMIYKLARQEESSPSRSFKEKNHYDSFDTIRDLEKCLIKIDRSIHSEQRTTVIKDNPLPRIQPLSTYKIDNRLDLLESNVSDLRNAQSKLSETSNNNDFKITELERFCELLADIPQENLQSILSAASVTEQKMADHQAAITRHLQELTAAQQDFNQQKSRILKEIETTARIAAEQGITASHLKTAAAEKKTANWLRLGALFFMICSTGVLIYTLSDSGLKDPVQTAYRIITSLLLTLPAVYLARESARHRQQQHRYHELALNVAAVNPLISGLEKSDQDRIRGQIASDLLATQHGGAAQPAPAAEPFPLDMNAVVLKLLEKVDLTPGKPASAPPAASSPSAPPASAATATGNSEAPVTSAAAATTDSPAPAANTTASADTRKAADTT